MAWAGRAAQIGQCAKSSSPVDREPCAAGLQIPPAEYGLIGPPREWRGGALVKFIPIADQNETRRVVGMETKRDEARASVPQELQGVPTRLQYERRDDDDQGRSDEASATLQRQSCTDLRADDVCNSHGEAGVPQNVATSDEPTQCICG